MHIIRVLGGIYSLQQWST